MLHFRDGARFPPDVTPGIQAKEVNIVIIRPENLVSYVDSVLFQIMSNQFNLQQVDSIEVVETSQG